LRPFQAGLEGVVVESTYNWYWLVDGLMEAGYRANWRPVNSRSPSFKSKAKSNL
jgi:hypothetical protein